MLLKSRVRRFTTLVLLTACLTATLPAPSIRANEPQTNATEPTDNTLPVRLAGIWKGEGTQTGVSGGWSISIALKPGKVGDTLGTIAYPSLGCGGELTLRSVNGDSIEVSEVITYGKECADSGIVTLKPIANHTVEYQWNSPNYPGIAASGTVTKINTEGQATPVDYMGVWEGTGTQSNAAGEEKPTSVLMTLANGAPGSVIGTIVNPLNGCGGELTLQGVNADSIELSEEITYGENCPAKGIVKLKLGENSRMKYEWRSLLDSSTGTSTLMPVK